MVHHRGVLTFAVGIGLNVAVFSIVDRVLFRPLPYADPDRLVLMRVCDAKGECYGSFPSLLALEARERSTTLDDVAVAAFPAVVRISEAAEEPPLRLSGVSPNLLRVLQVQPVEGRDFTDEDATLKRRVALLTHQTWQRRFAGNAGVLGRTLGSGPSVSATYFDALRTPFLAGRHFTASEADARVSVAILNVSAVRAFFPHSTLSAIIGTRLSVDGDPPRTIVGVVPDLKGQYAETSGPAMFLPLGAEPSNYPAAIIRVPGGTAPPLAQLQQRLSAALGFRVIPQASSIAERLDAGLADSRFRAVLFAVLSAAALLLAAVGLFAVASFETTSRRYEMGVRLTLGASRTQIRRTVILDACQPVLVGMVLGLVGAFWGEQCLKNFMYGVEPRDPLMYGSVILILLTTAVIAAWLPATRTSRLDPAEVLRSQ